MPILLSSPSGYQLTPAASEWRDAGGGRNPISAAIDGRKTANTSELNDKYHGNSRQWFRVDWQAPQDGDYEIKLWLYNGNRSAPVPATITVNGTTIINDPDIRQGNGTVESRSFQIPQVKIGSLIRFYSESPAVPGIFWFVEIECWRH